MFGGNVNIANNSSSFIKTNVDASQRLTISSRLSVGLNSSQPKRVTTESLIWVNSAATSAPGATVGVSVTWNESVVKSMYLIKIRVRDWAMTLVPTRISVSSVVGAASCSLVNAFFKTSPLLTPLNVNDAVALRHAHCAPEKPVLQIQPLQLRDGRPSIPHSLEQISHCEPIQSLLHIHSIPEHEPTSVVMRKPLLLVQDSFEVPAHWV